jgi:CRP/FNR family transcriptional regulator, cyclic AMP receptor protein
MKSDVLGIINQVPILGVLNFEELSEFLAKAKKRIIPRFSYIYSPGSSSETIYFLIKGVVKIAIQSEHGREAIKSILDAPGMFGEQAITGESFHDEFAIAMQDGAVIYEVEINDFRELMEKNHMVSKEVIAFLGKKVKQIEKRLESQIFKNARDRIIDFIKESACKRGYRVGYDWFLKRNLTQQEIANYTGTSRQTVTEVFNELRKANQIYFNRNKILIRDSFNLVCEDVM